MSYDTKDHKAAINDVIQKIGSQNPRYLQVYMNALGDVHGSAKKLATQFLTEYNALTDKVDTAFERMTE